MARLSQKQLEEMAQQKHKTEKNDFKEPDINEITQTNQTTFRYALPQQEKQENKVLIPDVNPSDYPEINVRGSFPLERQKRGANLLLLKEIDNVLSEVDVGNNRNATLNFLIWVGLQTLKGMSSRVTVKVNEKTYADGGIVTSFLEY